MRKALVIVIVVLLILAAGAYYLNSQSTRYVRERLTQELATSVHIGRVTLGLHEIVIEDLEVADPASPERNILTVKRIGIDYKLASLIGRDPITINKITIDRPFAFIQAYNNDGSDNNWLNFLKKIQEGPASTTRPVLIDTLAIINLSADLQHPILGFVHLPVRKPIVIKNINSGNRLQTEAQLSVIVAALMEVLSQYKGLNALTNGIATVVTLPAGVIANVTGQLVGQASDLITTSAAAVGDVIGAGIESVKDFFNNLLG